MRLRPPGEVSQGEVGPEGLGVEIGWEICRVGVVPSHGSKLFGGMGDGGVGCGWRRSSCIDATGLGTQCLMDVVPHG